MRLFSGICLFVAIALLVVQPTGAAVKVVDDEVVFTLRAPDAERVFLVGDFNNWNPTLEKMEKQGDTFILRLYLLPGRHRYKYVVDGKWGVDPDNLPSDPKRGSVLVLEERSGMLVMGSEDVVETEKEVRLEPSLRYAAGFLVDDGETHSNQALDFYFAWNSKRLRANVDFQTTNDTWQTSPLQARVWFNMGFVEVRLGDALLTAFENDTVWTSSDPFVTLGDVGIFDYNVARERKGFSFESPELLKTRIRAFYADKFEEPLPTPVTIPVSAFAGFPGSTSPDTLVYRYDTSNGDADTWAFAIDADLGSFGLGYINRHNRGLHPGLLADVTRGGGAFDLSTFNTREDWGADVLWARWRFVDGLTLAGGFGHSNAELNQAAFSSSTTPTLGEVGIGQDTTPFDSRIPLQSSKRWDGSLGFDKHDVSITFGYQWNEFDFDPVVYEASRAEINSIDLDVAVIGARWKTGGSIRYLDQDYGATPVDFHYFTPARNFWLDWGDALDVVGQVTFDMPRATALALNFGWDPSEYDPTRRLGSVVPLGLLVSADLVTVDFFDLIEYWSVRVDGEYGITDRWYFDVHARFASYDKASWQLDDTYFDAYLESGYRNNHIEISVGLGPDPIVLDPVPNEFLNNGWEQVLRQGIPASLTRDQSTLLGQGLQRQERLLEGVEALKLEFIVFF